MPLRATVHSVLLADERVTAIIGVGDVCRHYAQKAPQGVRAPYSVSSEVAGDAQTTHGQPGDAEDSLDETVLQFTSLAIKAADAIALRKAIRAALLEDVNGLFAAAHIVVAGAVTRFVTEDEVDLHGAQLDVTFFHNPST